MATSGLDAALEAAAWQGLQRVAIYLKGQLQQVLNVSADPYRKRRTRDTSAGPAGSYYTAYRSPAPKGQPPHKRTGHGQAGVTFVLDRPALTARFGVIQNVEYMIHPHEMKDHPWLLVTAQRLLPQLATLAGYGIGATRTP